MANRDQAVKQDKQGFVRQEDLTPEAEDGTVMPPQEIDHHAEKAASGLKKSDELQGEGNYEAAQSYNEAATDFAHRQDDKKGERP
ncbi:MAG TPA: hypothetical protein PLD20_21750 [Blastocatellia bacterium]|nr:hypothetical protein [Blastocatellia bacterium]HMV86065.1 hypothetical protein [Blastocatellia bacterium]HMX27970.1 hypothetical protein [Blastocatellia bacterium]HMZ20577.1 hypothetical protein [Blastocatellia bacterium]HNG31990.1 hypothetical protein [Blastocatellia bacterium]